MSKLADDISVNHGSANEALAEGTPKSKEPHVAQPELQGYCTLRHIDFTSSFTVTKTLHENIETFPSKLKSQLDLELTGFQLKSGCICFLQNRRILTITF